jgi:hypothetical protein
VIVACFLVALGTCGSLLRDSLGTIAILSSRPRLKIRREIKKAICSCVGRDDRRRFTPLLYNTFNMHSLFGTYYNLFSIRNIVSTIAIPPSPIAHHHDMYVSP